MNYDLNHFIAKYKDSDYIDLVELLSREVPNLDARYLRLKRNEYDYGLKNYREHVGDFLFYLNTGMIPAGIQITGLSKFQPIIENFVRKGQFKPEALDIFKSQ